MNPDETLVRFSRARHLPTTALRAVLRAQELFGVSLGLAFVEFQNHHGKLGEDFVDDALRSLDAEDAEAVARLLRDRFAKIPERRRPHYEPAARFDILELKQRNGWSAEHTAYLFLVSPNTIYNWLSEVNHESQTVGSLVKPQPPVRRFADVVRQLVRTLDRLGFGGNATIAATLARAGYRLSARSVGRIRKEAPPPEPTPASDALRNTLRAEHPNHISMADVTEIPSRFRLFRFHLAVVLDVFSRMPLAWSIFYFKPTARQMARLFQSAMKRFGKPRVFVSDQGSEFTGKIVRRYLQALGVEHRFGAVGQYGSIAIVERFWKTLKQALRAHFPAPPLVRGQLADRLRLELLHFTHFRPHQGLDGATPAEIYFGNTPRHLDATDPPRARPGEGPTELPLRFAFLDKEPRLPVLIRRAA